MDRSPLLSLNAMPSDQRLLIGHPCAVEHRWLLVDLPARALYVRIDDQASSPGALDHAFAQAAHVQVDGAPPEWVVIDESDRAAGDALLPLVRRLLDDGVRVVLLTRATPAALLQDSGLRELAHFIPGSTARMLTDYARRVPRGRVLLEVRAFGPGRIHVDGTEMANWEGFLPRSLFFYLIDRGMATRNEIFEVFWPTLSLKEATNVFHVTKRKVNELLGFNLTTFDGGYYRLSDDVELLYDVGHFHDLVQHALVTPPAQAFRYLEMALEMSRGGFLMTLDADWARARAQALRGGVVDALILQGKAAEALGQPQRALTIYTEAFQRQPLREDAVLHMLRVSEAHNWADGALSAYERLAAFLRARLNISPTPEVQGIAATLRERKAAGLTLG